MNPIRTTLAAAFALIFTLTAFAGNANAQTGGGSGSSCEVAFDKDGGTFKTGQDVVLTLTDCADATEALWCMEGSPKDAPHCTPRAAVGTKTKKGALGQPNTTALVVRVNTSGKLRVVLFDKDGAGIVEANTEPFTIVNAGGGIRTAKKGGAPAARNATDDPKAACEKLGNVAAIQGCRASLDAK